MTRAQKIEALRSAVRRATTMFLEAAPERGHGSVALSDRASSDMILSYRRVDREYGIYVEREGTKLLCIPLDSAPDAQLIAGAMRLQALYDVVWENSTEDERSIETAIDSALSFVEEFEGRTARKEA